MLESHCIATGKGIVAIKQFKLFPTKGNTWADTTVPEIFTVSKQPAGRVNKFKGWLQIRIGTFINLEWQFIFRLYNR